jgi:hypothetical protein
LNPRTIALVFLAIVVPGWRDTWLQDVGTAASSFSNNRITDPQSGSCVTRQSEELAPQIDSDSAAPHVLTNRVRSKGREVMPLESEDHRRKAAWSVFGTLVLLAVLALMAALVL